MDNNELGVSFAAMHLAELHHQVDQRRHAGRRRRDRAPGWPRRLDRHDQAADHAGGGRTVAVAAASNPERATMEVAMLIQHQHKLLTRSSVRNPG